MSGRRGKGHEIIDLHGWVGRAGALTGEADGAAVERGAVVDGEVSQSVSPGQDVGEHAPCAGLTRDGLHLDPSARHRWAINR